MEQRKARELNKLEQKELNKMEQRRARALNKLEQKTESNIYISKSKPY